MVDLSQEELDSSVAGCPICGSDCVGAYLDGVSDRQRESGRTRTFRYLQCRTCYAIFLSPMPSASAVSSFYPPASEYYAYQAQASPRSYTWLRRIGTKRSIGAVLIRRLFFPFLRLHSSGRVLDIGCGAGHFLNVMQEMRWETWGMEMSQEAVEIAGTRHRVVHASTLSAAHLPQGYFDLITMFQVIEHLVEPVQTMEAAYALLKSGGRLVMHTPNGESRLAQHFGRDWRGLECPRHVCLYGPRALAHLLKGGGFHNIRYRTRPAPSDLIDSLRLRAESSRQCPGILCRIPRDIAMYLLLPWTLYGMLRNRGNGSLLEATAEREDKT